MSYSWPEGKRAAFVFSVDVDIESPMLWRMRGQEIRGFGELEQRRYGERVGLKRLLALQAELGIKASYYVPGYEAEQYDWILPTLQGQGHEVGLHGYYHELVNQLSPAENAEVLDKSIAVFEKQLGVTPKGYRSPAWELTQELPEQLKERGVVYDSSLMGYDHPYTVNGLTEIPVQWLLDDAIYFKFSGGGLDKWYPPSPYMVLESWLEEWEAIYETGGLFMLTVHPWVSGKGQRIRMLRRLVEEVQGRSDVWLATAQELAEHHQGSANSFEVSLTPPDTRF
ncbi:MAG: polysaccharide deacetylase [Trueperaceae bacterium]|nr:polysaccharide deacetylase [Trueperaceae bacterium]